MGNVTSLSYSDRTDIGRRRSSNQDAKAVLAAESADYRSRGWFFLVADGMGAHAAGELASSMAAERVPRIYRTRSEFSPPLALRSSLEQANGEINKKGESSFEFRGMGTTCTTLVLLPRGAIIGHVGDSRCYRVRKHTIEQLSRDHSLVWELEAAGGMSREQAAGAAPKNIITRSMGPHADVEIDLEGPFPVESGDVFVLCSDGLSGQVGDPEIGMLAAELDPPEATAALVGLALVRGAPDNVTVVVAKAGDDEATRPARGHEAWPLTEEATSNRQKSHRSWRALAIAGVGLLGALMFNPWSELTAKLTAISAAFEAVCFVGSILALATFLGGSLYAMLGFTTPDAPRGRFLHPGEFLGKGPYRRHDGTPTEPLVEGVLVSVEAAAEELPAADRDRALGITSRARQHAAAGAFHEAVTAAAEAIAVYARHVEARRRDDTHHAAAEPPPSA